MALSANPDLDTRTAPDSEGSPQLALKNHIDSMKK